MSFLKKIEKISPHKLVSFSVGLFIFSTLIAIIAAVNTPEPNLYKYIGVWFGLLGGMSSFIGVILSLGLSGKSDVISDQNVRLLSDIRHNLQGLEVILPKLIDFLQESKDSELFYALIDSTSIGYGLKNIPKCSKKYSSLSALQRDVLKAQDSLCDISQTSSEFYLTTLRSKETFEASHEVNKHVYKVTSLEDLGHYFSKISKKPDEELRMFNELQEIHQANLRQIKSNLKQNYLYDQKKLHLYHLETDILPFQFYARRKNNELSAFIIMYGTYNIETITHARGMITSDSELVKAYISIYETLSGLDNPLINKGEYTKLVDRH